MIELKDDDDPMLFGVNLPNGRFVMQYMEVASMLQTLVPPNSEPTTAHVIDAMRKGSRTPDTAMNAQDQVLIAVWHRVSAIVEKQGKG